MTIEPCLMCYGAMIHARIKNLFFGADELKRGEKAILFQLIISI